MRVPLFCSLVFAVALVGVTGSKGAAAPPDLNPPAQPFVLGKKRPSFLSGTGLVASPGLPTTASEPDPFAPPVPFGKKKRAFPIGDEPAVPLPVHPVAGGPATAPAPDLPAEFFAPFKKRPFVSSSGAAPSAVAAVPTNAAPTTNLTDAARRVRECVVLFTTPDGWLGTGVVISRTHRLVATNAHIADMHQLSGGKMFAIRNGTDTKYEIERMWYHRGVMRKLDWPLVARSANPADGEIDPFSPDVAVVQLKAGGPDLPEPPVLAGPDEYGDLQAQEVGMIGYPWHDNLERVLTGRGQAAATFHSGRISRVTNYYLRTESAQADQLLQYTMPGASGFSGSPVFTASGKLVGLHNSARTPKFADKQAELAHGVRVDVLYELLVLEGLGAQVPVPVAKDRLVLDRYREPDPASEKARIAFEKVRDVRIELDRHRSGESDFLRAYWVLSAWCDQVIGAFPDYASPRVLKAIIAVHKSAGERGANVQKKEALGAARDAVDAAPKSPEGQLALAEALVRWATRDRAHDPDAVRAATDATTEEKRATTDMGEAVEILERLVTANGLDSRIRAHVHRVRALALASALQKYPEGLSECDKAIKLKPDLAILYALRADLYRKVGKRDAAERDEKMYRRLNLVWAWEGLGVRGDLNRFGEWVDD